MPRKNVDISNEILESLEKKITNRVMANMDRIISKKVKEVFAQSTRVETEDEQILRHEIEALKSDWLFLQKEIGKLHEKSDHMLGSLTYIASEYDSFSNSITKLNSQNQTLTKDIQTLIGSVARTSQQQTETEKLDDLEQYGRRENHEIHGVPWTRNACTNEIVQKVAKILNVKLTSNDISTSHRLFNSGIVNANEKNQHPPIIVRFANRDKRNELFCQRLKLNTYTRAFSSEFPKFLGLVPHNLTIRENLIKFRKFLFNETSKLKHAMNYQYL